MSAGTLTVFQNSVFVNGTGTEFTTDVTAGGFIVFRSGGVDYTMPVQSVINDAQLQLVSPFRGVQEPGITWDFVPQNTMAQITAGIVAQNTEALRGLNYDKQNWQQIFSGSGQVTVKLPDNSSFSGPSWNYLASELNDASTQISDISTQMDGKAGRAANLSDLTDKAEARSQLGLYRTSGRWYQSSHPEVASRFGFYGITNTDPNEMLVYIGKDCLRIKGIFRSNSSAILAGNTVITVKPIDIDGVTRANAASTFTPVSVVYVSGLQPATLSYLSTSSTTSGAQLNIPLVGASQGVVFFMFDLHIGFTS